MCNIPAGPCVGWTLVLVIYGPCAHKSWFDKRNITNGRHCACLLCIYTTFNVVTYCSSREASVEGVRTHSDPMWEGFSSDNRIYKCPVYNNHICLASRPTNLCRTCAPSSSRSGNISSSSSIQIAGWTVYLLCDCQRYLGGCNSRTPGHTVLLITCAPSPFFRWSRCLRLCFCC